MRPAGLANRACSLSAQRPGRAPARHRSTPATDCPAVRPPRSGPDRTGPPIHASRTAPAGCRRPPARPAAGSANSPRSSRSVSTVYDGRPGQRVARSSSRRSSSSPGSSPMASDNIVQRCSAVAPGTARCGGSAAGSMRTATCSSSRAARAIARCPRCTGSKVPRSRSAGSSLRPAPAGARHAARPRPPAGVPAPARRRRQRAPWQCGRPARLGHEALPALAFRVPLQRALVRRLPRFPDAARFHFSGRLPPRACTRARPAPASSSRITIGINAATASLHRAGRPACAAAGGWPENVASTKRNTS